MAISWGSWDYGNTSAGFRVGFEVTRSSVSHSSTSVTWTVKVYVEAMYNVNDLMTVTCSGNISGSDEQNLTTGSSGGYKLWFTKTHTYTYGSTSYGSSPGSRTFRADLSGVYNGANPYKSATYSIPARPYAAPAAPTSVAATRNSDSQATVTWVNHATAGEPYTSLLVQKREYSGSSWSAWSNVGTTSSTATSLVVTGLTSNRAYQFQVRANNSVGSSAFASGNVIYMTPAAPSSVQSSLDASGSTITTTWVNNAYIEPGITYSIARSVNGAAYATVTTGVAQSAGTWTDPTPGAGTNRYRVQAYQSNGSLYSANVEGNTVSTIVAPLAPTNLAPNGATLDLNNDVVLTWQHNDGGDGAAQSQFEVQESLDGGTTWGSLGAVASAQSSATIVAPHWSNGTTPRWRVRTMGIASAGWGPFSAAATVVGSSTPTATLSSPTDPVTTLPVTVAWSYNQDEGSAQTSWEVQLVRASDGVVANTASGTDAATSTEFSGSKLTDGVTYTARVRVKSGAGLWSDWAESGFTVDLLLPAGATVSGAYDPDTGTVVLSLDREDVAAKERFNTFWNPSLPVDTSYWTATMQTGGTLVGSRELGENPNLAANPGAETVNSGWAVNGAQWTRTFDTSVFHSGAQSAKCVPDGTTGTAILSLYAVGHDVGGSRASSPLQAYTSRVWGMSTVPDSRAQMQVQWRDASNVTIRTDVSDWFPMPLAGEWYQFEQLVRSPAGTASSIVILVIHTPVGGTATTSDAAWADDAEWREGWPGPVLNGQRLPFYQMKVDTVSTGALPSTGIIFGSPNADCMMLTPGVPNTVSVLTRSSVANRTASLVVTSHKNDGTNQTVEISGPATAIGGTDWVLLTATFTPAAGQVRGYARIYAQAGDLWAAGDVIHGAAVLCEASATAGDFFAGDTPPVGEPPVSHEWVGAAGQSQSRAFRDVVAVETVTVERLVEGGEWETLIEGLELPTDLLDVTPLTAGANTYRVTSVSGTPTYYVNADVVVDGDPQGWVFVNYGSDYTTLLRFHTEPKVSESAGREQALVQLLGRKKPVALFGEGTSLVVKASGVLLFDPTTEDGGLDSPPTDWREAAQAATTVCFRDFTGRRVFGLLSDVSTADTAPGEATVGFTVTEGDT